MFSQAHILHHSAAPLDLWHTSVSAWWCPVCLLACRLSFFAHFAAESPRLCRREYCNFTCLSPDMPDFHVACLRVFILPPWIPFQVQPPAFYTLVAEFEARGFESTPTSESGYRTRVLWESSILWRHECGFNTALNALSYRGSLGHVEKTFGELKRR